jgi:hypothetical protein
VIDEKQESIAPAYRLVWRRSSALDEAITLAESADYFGNGTFLQVYPAGLLILQPGNTYFLY